MTCAVISLGQGACLQPVKATAEPQGHHFDGQGVLVLTPFRGVPRGGEAPIQPKRDLASPPIGRSEGSNAAREELDERNPPLPRHSRFACEVLELPTDLSGMGLHPRAMPLIVRPSSPYLLCHACYVTHPATLTQDRKGKCSWGSAAWGPRWVTRGKVRELQSQLRSRKIERGAPTFRTWGRLVPVAFA